MVVRIRLARWGQRNRPFYRIVAADARAKRDGRFIEVLGAYNPISHSKREAAHHVKRVWLNVHRIKYWVSVGAQPTTTMARLLGTAGVLPHGPRSVPRQTAASSATTPPARALSSFPSPVSLHPTSPPIGLAAAAASGNRPPGTALAAMR